MAAVLLPDILADILNVADASPLLLSACLAGEACRYDGRGAPHPLVLRLVEQRRVVLVCPEVLGGLATPRGPVELRDGRAVGQSGQDVTAAFVAGAHRALALARDAGCRRAILKARSPSCGVGRVYSGDFSGALVSGDGILAALLKAEGFTVCSESDLPE